ncbi:MAG: hypothetical protein ACRCUY_04080 [Thermoguttaceae bacterium]
MNKTKNVFKAVVIFLCLSSILFGDSSTDRDWKDATGKILGRGEFVSLMDGEVCILTPDGTGKTIPFDKLCKSDQLFAEKNGDDLGKIAGELPETESIGVVKPAKKSDSSALTRPIISETNSGAGASAKSEPLREKNPDVDIPDNQVMTESSSATSDDSAHGDIQTKVKDEKDKYAGQKRVIMFDFESLWDTDSATRYGEIMGNMFWIKINRQKGFIIPESMIDVRSICETYDIKPNNDTPLDKMKEYVTKTFNSDIGIWGKIERVDKDVMEIYDFWMKVVDFSVDPPNIIYEVNNVRTDAVAEVTGIYVRAGMEKLYNSQGRTAAEKASVEQNWAKNPNLMEGGDFEKVSGNIPVGWETRCAQHREPIGRLVKRVADPEKPGNHYLHTEFDAGMGDGFGLMYYSKPFPIEEMATYRIEYRYKKSSGVKPIVFIKCYDTIDTIFRPTAEALKEGFTDKIGQQTREVYRSQQNLFVSPANEWVSHTEEFTPRHTRFSPKFARVMLFGYMGAGSIDYDDFVFKKIKEADPAELKAKVLRHSLDSKVTMKEMEENERRGTDSRNQIRQEIEHGPSEEKNKTKLK